MVGVEKVWLFHRFSAEKTDLNFVSMFEHINIKIISKLQGIKM